MCSEKLNIFSGVRASYISIVLRIEYNSTYRPEGHLASTWKKARLAFWDVLSRLYNKTVTTTPHIHS